MRYDSARLARGLLGVTILLAGCAGGRSGSNLAVRVGEGAITTSEVDHWAALATLGRAPSGAHAGVTASGKATALHLLITWRWLSEEARQEGRAVSRPAIRRRVEDKERSMFPGGKAELESFLQASGQTVDDLEHEAAAELAREAIEETIRRRTPRVTSEDVAAYYARHLHAFVVREQREIRITNRKHFVEAATIRSEVERGRLSTASFERELRELPADLATGARPVLERAIRRAVPGHVAGPVKQLAVGTVYDYFVFEVKRVIPARTKSLAEVRGEIARQLAAQSSAVTRKQFIRAWRVRWTAQTDCTHGYVAQKCRQYAGPLRPEDETELK